MPLTEEALEEALDISFKQLISSWTIFLLLTHCQLHGSWSQALLDLLVHPEYFQMFVGLHNALHLYFNPLNYILLHNTKIRFLWKKS